MNPMSHPGTHVETDDRKRAEVALRENEASLAHALWGARAAFWQWQVASDVAIMSPLWFAMTGYTREQWESVANPWRARIHPDDLPEVLLQLRQHLDGQSPSIEVEYRIRTASGEWKWMLTRARAVEWDAQGKATSAVGVSLDIDAQKRAERELLSSEARLETAVWGAGMGLWEHDFRCDDTRWYSDWCDRLDLDPCEGQDHTRRWDANIHAEDVTESARRFRDHVAGKADYYDAEYRIRDRKGRWRWLFERGRVVARDAAGSALRMVGVCMDIEERKEAELEYIRSQRRLEVALESARGGMWDWDVGSGEARHTEFYYHMLGVESAAGQQTNTLWSTRVHPEDLRRVRAALQDVVEGRKQLYEAEYRLRHEDGTWRWILDRARAPERDARGRATRMVGFLVDVTERKRLEREIIEIANREQQRIGSDLHDGLGQELTGIALMLRGVAAQLRKESSAARHDVEDVIGLVNNAIESTRTLARGLSPVSGERGGLAAALQTLAARASERYGVRVRLSANFTGPLRLSETAATHVYRIVQEALTNVIRHSHATEVEIGLEITGGELQLRVDDNGRGFEQPPPDSEGGLGLKIMRYRAQMLGGDLILESGMQGGASVRCSCPLDGSASSGEVRGERDPVPRAWQPGRPTGAS